MNIHHDDRIETAIVTAGIASALAVVATICACLLKWMEVI
jgi:hypothetical protein